MPAPTPGPSAMDPLKFDLGADELDIKAEVPTEPAVRGPCCYRRAIEADLDRLLFCRKTRRKRWKRCTTWCSTPYG